MHLAHATLSLSTLLALIPISLTLADEKADLGYLKCVSAVIKTTHFPECTSSHKLDCFCEAAAPRPSPSSSSIASSTADRVWTFQLPPETEDICASFGVPRDEIPKYLCNDSAVPVSPRRGSTPMGRVEQPLSDDEKRFDSVEEASSGGANQAKRAIQPEGARLLIPENEPIGNSPPAAAPAPAHAVGKEVGSKNEKEKEEEEEEQEEEKDQDMGEDRALDDAEHAVYEVVTVTKTETRCSCAKTTTTTGTETPTAAKETESSPDSEEKTSGALHGTDVAVATHAPDSELELETEADLQPTDASSSVRVASSPVRTPVTPTGVDAGREEHGGDKPTGESFQGGAVSGKTFSKSIGVLLGLTAGFILL
ncbi:hypothetical protein BJY01DRAFT_243418 [Aspergillus pseudoustus]|uniref:Extracellular membrane protein CFEM domain-containing protein n=1 Tax=Aspergillus pseudoustus TaxID=1810923 RepID=A0ABR4KRS6_9EURO